MILFPALRAITAAGNCCILGVTGQEIREIDASSKGMGTKYEIRSQAEFR